MLKKMYCVGTLGVVEKFLLAVKSRDLSQADKIIIRVSSFPNLRYE